MHVNLICLCGFGQKIAKLSIKVLFCEKYESAALWNKLQNNLLKETKRFYINKVSRKKIYLNIIIKWILFLLPYYTFTKQNFYLK